MSSVAKHSHTLCVMPVSTQVHVCYRTIFILDWHAVSAYFCGIVGRGGLLPVLGGGVTQPQRAIAQQ